MLLKLKRTPAIYLVGFMGSGKTTVGRVLADELGWAFFDLDEEIGKRAGKTIPEIFEQQGEGVFREIESDALMQRVAQVRNGRPQVVAMGGGTFTSEENIDLALNNGVAIWLDAPLSVIEERVGQETNRPLARDQEKLRKLFADRQLLYARADYRIDIAGLDTPGVVARVLALPIFVP